MSITITDHAYQRAKERLSWSRATLDRMAKIAHEKGTRPKEVSGSLRRYLDKSGIEHHTQPIIYGQHVYCFGKELALITILHLPQKHRKS